MRRQRCLRVAVNLCVTSLRPLRQKLIFTFTYAIVAAKIGVIECDDGVRQWIMWVVGGGFVKFLLKNSQPALHNSEPFVSACS